MHHDGMDKSIKPPAGAMETVVHHPSIRDVLISQMETTDAQLHALTLVPWKKRHEAS
jgi:hypothetical protein